MAMTLFLQQAAPVSSDALRDQIQQTVHDATQAAQEAAQAAADAQATQGSGVHKVVITPRGDPARATTIQYDNPPPIPPQVEPISIAFFAMVAFILVGRPLTKAFGRRLDRQAVAPSQIPRGLTDQLQQISQSVDAIAIEVERISEAQRFTTKMFAEKQSDVTMISPSSAGRP